MIWNRSTVPTLALVLISKVEAFRGKAYDDGGGHWTIGYGSLHMPSGAPVQPGMVISLADATTLLSRQCLTWVSAIVGQVHAATTENEAAALISFTHNLGAGRLVGSTLVAMVNAAQAVLASRQFGGWVLEAGVKSLGLMRRRELERRVFLGGGVAEYDAVWQLQFADLLPAYQQSFVDAAAWHRAATAPPAVRPAPVLSLQQSTADSLMAAELATLKAG